jgi:hypothetical protein
MYHATAMSSAVAPRRSRGDTTPGWKYVPGPAWVPLVRYIIESGDGLVYLIIANLLLFIVFHEKAEELDHIRVLIAMLGFSKHLVKEIVCPYMVIEFVRGSVKAKDKRARSVVRVGLHRDGSG